MDEQTLGATTGGVWTASEAYTAGMSRRQIEGRVTSGEWQVLRRGIYAYGGVAPSAHMRGWAAVLAAGGQHRAWATGRTTLRLLRLPLIDDDDPATSASDWHTDDVLVTRAVRSRSTLRVTRTAVSPGDRGAYGGCPSVSLPHALLAAAGVLSFEAMTCVLDAVLHSGRLSTEDLVRLVLSREGRRSVRPLRKAVASADGRAESPLETLGRLVLLPVLPALVPQLEVVERGIVLARLDLADEQIRLAVEGDGRATHAGMAADDHRRDRVVAARGWRTERYTWFDARCRPAELRRRILAAAKAQAAAVRRDCA